MLCEECKERPATVHLAKIVDGVKTEHHLCETCAHSHESFFSHSPDTFNFNQLLSGLLNMESSSGYNAQVATTLRCETCGMTYSEFTKVGRFGCPDCYDSFAPRLDPLLRRIQSNTSHAGKIPMRTGEQVKRRKSLERLRKDLQQAIASEHFERAAQLRDEIHALEQQAD